MARSKMQGYQEQHWKWDSAKPLQAIAKGFDYTLGNVIKSGVKAFASISHPGEAETIAKNAVTFRQKRHFDVLADGQWQKELGRSYGADIVSFTFDFAMASVGDALTRNVIQAFDPNVKKTWMVNDAGAPAARGEKKHFVLGEGLKALGRSSWRIISKNQGEDWAAAIPYAFQMKFQRQFLSSIFEQRFNGHKIVFDNNWNGGAYKINQHGQIVGDYQLVGAIDLHARFVGYNWYTLMFREGYDTIGNAFNAWKKDGFAIHAPHLPEHFNPITTPIDALAHSMRYVTKSFIKANLYMNPAVVPFWVMRVSQSKWRGHNYISTENTHELGPETHVWNKNVEGYLRPYDTSNYDHYPTDTAFNRFEKGFSQFLNRIGRGPYKLGIKAGRAADKLSNEGLFPRSPWFDNLITHDLRRPWEPITERQLFKGRRNLMHEYVDASMAYTPYMFAKAELGLRVDDTKGDGSLGQMDKAIYRFMDNVASFNLSGTGQSLKEMWRLGTRFEREKVVREGGVLGNEQGTQAGVKKPETTIDSASVQKSSTKRAHNDNERSANDNDHANSDDKSWVQSVIGREVNPAHIHAATPTRH
ncbi:MAG: hypothetical protein K2X09_01870 [Rickettsiales bacterium]|nr:hypothetical protein [Rickettsiales bacterium]